MEIFTRGVLVAILTLHLRSSEADRKTHIARDVCPLQVLNYMPWDSGCNVELGTLKMYITYLYIQGYRRCTSTRRCMVYFTYNSKHDNEKIYDINQIILTAPYKTMSFDAACKNNGNPRTTLYINCSSNFFEHWCRNNAHCFEGQTCNIYGYLGVCSCQNDFFLLRGKCRQGNLPLDAECDNDIQCSGPRDGRICLARDLVNTFVKTCSCDIGFTKIKDSCISDNIFHDICIPGNQCDDASKICYPDYGNGLGVCVCKDEYIGFGKKCLIGNLSLGQVCERNEQCSLVTNSQCLGRCVCRDGYRSINESECIPKTVFVGGSCDWDEQCTGSSGSGLCRQSRCTCKEGYISFNQNCYPGNSTLNQTCEIHEQCSTVLNSMCENGTCMCRDGYTAVNSTQCQQEENIEFIQREYQLQKSSFGTGMTLGAIFGGFLFGVLLSVLVVYVIYRRNASDLKKREEPGVAFVGDAVYGTNSAVEVIQGETSVNQGKHVQQKVVNVPPYTPSIESPTYSNVQEAGKSRLINDNIYNHLNEKEENPEHNDHYDITPGTSRLAVTEDDYSHLNAERRNDRIILSQDDEYAFTEDSTSDNYFKLEKQ